MMHFLAQVAPYTVAIAAVVLITGLICAVYLLAYTLGYNDGCTDTSQQLKETQAHLDAARYRVGQKVSNKNNFDNFG
jgi:predicted permease